VPTPVVAVLPSPTVVTTIPTVSVLPPVVDDAEDEAVAASTVTSVPPIVLDDAEGVAVAASTPVIAFLPPVVGNAETELAPPTVTPKVTSVPIIADGEV
jgi:hypothetical protein